ncbi:MAG: helix-turn-helix domain-containing protein [Planctomycetota bacterium]
MSATVTAPNDAQAVRTIGLRPRDAARALGISERKLWSLTNAGEIPHVRLGRAVVYPVRELEAWLTDQAAKGGRR